VDLRDDDGYYDIGVWLSRTTADTHEDDGMRATAY
jgi:hypothetical protein